MPEGILLIDKPSGISSFDVIRRLRKELGVWKMGHAGTLDPLASGLMIIAVGPATKSLSDYLKLPKEYIADIRVGERTTTGDITGEVIESAHVTDISREDAATVLRGMTGTLSLAVPAYAAVKQGGVPLYKKARRGEEVTPPVRDMVVTEAELLDFVCAEGRCVARVRFAVASGVYIRSLAEEFGRRLGYPATIEALRRTKIGDFTIAVARTV